MKRNSSYDQNKTHLANYNDPKVTLCKTKVYDFKSSGELELVDCKKCQLIIDSMIRAKMREQEFNLKKEQNV